MIKAIFFDFDGVIVDSEKLHSDLTINYLRSNKIPIPVYEVYGAVGGNPKMNYWKRVYNTYKNNISCSYNEFVGGIRNAHKSLKDFDYSKIMFEDVPYVLNNLKNKGYLLALASSSPRDYLVKNLINCGLTNIFDFIISGQEIEHSKPSPDIYNKCIECFNLQRDECIVIEDSFFGIQAAKNAGLFTIAIKDYRFGIRQELADAFADNLTDAMDILISIDSGYNDVNGKI